MLNTSAIGMITLSLPLFNPLFYRSVFQKDDLNHFDSICDGVLAFEQLWIKSRTN